MEELREQAKLRAASRWQEQGSVLEAVEAYRSMILASYRQRE